MTDADNRPAVVGQVEPSVMQHTRGPWRVVVDEHPHRLGGKHVERRIFTQWEHPQLKGPLGVVNMGVGIGNHDQAARHMVSMSEADARLIAAAPDMLNALRSLLRHAERVNEVLEQECGVRFVDAGPLDMARDALKLAVGAA